MYTTAKNVFHGSLLSSMDYLYILNRFEIPSIPAGQELQQVLKVDATKGALISIKAQSLSTNYDLYLAPFEVVDLESIMVIYSSKSVNKVVNETGLSNFWSKYNNLDIQRGDIQSGEQTLFVTIKNNDSIATGLTYIEIVHQVFQ